MISLKELLIFLYLKAVYANMQELAQSSIVMALSLEMKEDVLIMQGISESLRYAYADSNSQNHYDELILLVVIKQSENLILTRKLTNNLKK